MVSRIPRKKKKKMARIPMEFNLLEWQDIKQRAKAMNIRPTEYIKDALISLAASVKEGQV